MKYIKKVDEYSINEELKIKMNWRGFLLGICIIATYRYYSSLHKEKKNITLSEMNQIIADVDNKPDEREKSAINKIKNSLISDLKQDNRISDDERKKLINAINSIPFVLVDSETIELITGKRTTLGCYFGYMDTVRNKVVTIILVDKERVKLGVHFDETILHELRHLVDDVLSPDIKNSYSEISNIVEILDKDIVMRNEEGKRKLKEKVNFYANKVAYNLLNDKSRINTPKIKEDIKDFAKDYYNIIYLDEKTMNYLTSPDEVYARFHGLKRWMIKNGFLRDMNDQITQELIIRMLSDEKMSDENIIKKDFFQLLFYMNIDFTGKTKSDMTKANSIVANYRDYISNERPA